MQHVTGWASDGPELFMASETGSGHKQYMVVEALPEGGWDWVAWGVGQTGQCLHGRADTLTNAMAAAERAAARLARAPVDELAAARYRRLQFVTIGPN